MQSVRFAAPVFILLVLITTNFSFAETRVDPSRFTRNMISSSHEQLKGVCERRHPKYLNDETYKGRVYPESSWPWLPTRAGMHVGFNETSYYSYQGDILCKVHKRSITKRVRASRERHCYGRNWQSGWGCSRTVTTGKIRYTVQCVDSQDNLFCNRQVVRSN